MTRHPAGRSTASVRRARRSIRLALGVLLFVALLATSCGSDQNTSSKDPATVDELLAVDLGGTGSTGQDNQNAFSLPNRSVPGDERGRFEIGDSFFTQNWVTAPASTTSRDGLGPLFNAEACASCHVLDGRAEPPDESDPHRPGLLFRLSVPDASAPGGSVGDPTYGGQLQDHAILGVTSEASVKIDNTEIAGTFADGSPYSLLSPTYSIVDPAYGPTAPDLEISPRIAPPTIGMGLLEAVPDSTILAGADPDDKDRDGVSGRPNWVQDVATGSEALGRFGWKANVPSVAQQTAGAFHGDIGVTSPLLPDPPCSPVQTDCLGAIDGGQPEVDTKTFEDVVFYTRILAVPKRRAAADGSDRNGAEVFLDLGCASCHAPTLTTGESDIPALANQTIHPYTDLLLHDMGEGLADGRPDGQATGTEWRTAPLWGIGLTQTVNGHTRFLHDGRARNLSEAILWHGGEAQKARDDFAALDADQRQALIDYLETL